jgi:NAD(P)-dependent dehydrogenase (short-subunit alcohol dehydrogenase family)
MTMASFDIEPPARPGPEDAGRAYLTVDVSRADETERAVGVIAERFGRIDVLVNNAGILDCHAVHDTPEDTWDRLMRVVNGVACSSDLVWSGATVVATQLGALTRLRGWSGCGPVGEDARTDACRRAHGRAGFRLGTSSRLDSANAARRDALEHRSGLSRLSRS